MNDNLTPQEEHKLIKTMFQALSFWKELLAESKKTGMITDHEGTIRIRVAVAESILLDLVPDNLLNELGF